MNDNAKAWVVALRSGQFKQGTGRLRSTDANGDHRYCCLGVACELAVQAGVIPPSEDGLFGVGIDKDGGHLPVSVRDWLGLREVDGWHRDLDSINDDLVSMNDSGKSFAEIADFIESEPDGLFA